MTYLDTLRRFAGVFTILANSPGKHDGEPGPTGWSSAVAALHDSGRSILDANKNCLALFHGVSMMNGFSALTKQNASLNLHSLTIQKVF